MRKSYNTTTTIQIYIFGLTLNSKGNHIYSLYQSVVTKGTYTDYFFNFINQGINQGMGFNVVGSNKHSRDLYQYYTNVNQFIEPQGTTGDNTLKLGSNTKSTNNFAPEYIYVNLAQLSLFFVKNNNPELVQEFNQLYPNANSYFNSKDLNYTWKDTSNTQLTSITQLCFIILLCLISIIVMMILSWIDRK